MSKIDLDPITSGYNLSKINANFQKVEDELNNKVLYRNPPAGEPNSMSSNLDMNGKQILNVTTGTSDGSLVTKWYVDQGLALKFDKSGGPLSGPIDMGNNEILNTSRLSTDTLEIGGVPVVPTDLAVYYYNETREALRRSYAEAGYNLVDGSFEAGGTLVNTNDVLLQERTGKAFSGPAGTVAAGTVPSGPNYINRGDETLRSDLANPDKGAALVARASIYIRSVAELEALSLAEGVNVYLTEDGRAGDFVVKTGTPPSDPQKGIYIVLANGNYAERVEKERLYVTWFGAVGDGSTDDTASINGAITLAGNYGTIVFPDGLKSFLITSELIQLEGQQWVFEGGQRASKLLKGYNGNVVQMATLGRMISPFVDGNGAFFTGTNIVIKSGTFSQYLENVRTVKSVGPGILFETNAGGGNRINGIEGDTTDPENVGVIALTEDTTAVPRFWNDVYLSGGIIDITGGGNGLAVSNFYIRDIITGYTGTTRSAIYKFSNGRLADLGATTTITAADGFYNNVSFASNVTLDDCQGVKFTPTCTFTSITENRNSRFNSWFQQSKIFPTAWTASDGSPGNIGNGTLSMYYTRKGHLCKVVFTFIYGSTTTLPTGSGGWRFSLPFPGTAALTLDGIFASSFDSSESLDRFVLGQIPAGEASLGFGVGGQAVRNGYPFVWQSGDVLRCVFEYEVK